MPIKHTSAITCADCEYKDLLYTQEPCKSCKKEMDNLKTLKVGLIAAGVVNNYECLDVMLRTFGVDAVKTFCLLRAFECNYQADVKNGKQDMEKAVYYSSKYLELSK